MSHSYPYISHVLLVFFINPSTDECYDSLLDVSTPTDFWVATHGFQTVTVSRDASRTDPRELIIRFHLSGAGFSSAHLFDSQLPRSWLWLIPFVRPAASLRQQCNSSTLPLFSLPHVWRRHPTTHNTSPVVGSHRSCLLNRLSRSAIPVLGLIASLYDRSIDTSFFG